MKTRRVIALLLLVAIAGLVAAWWQIARQEPRKPDSNEGRDAIVRAFREIEERERAHDDTTWAAEMKALAHAEYFVRLWDSLRRSTNPLGTLSQVEINRAMIPQAVPGDQLSHGIASWTGAGDKQEIPGGQWGQWVSQFERAGWQLLQSEWRQFAFFPGTNSASRSIYEFELHLHRTTEPERAIVRGELLVTWSREGDRPDTIEVESLEILTQTGESLFKHAQSIELAPAPGIETLDPFLAAWDLDGNGLSDLALGAPNVALIRQANQFEPRALVAHPLDEMHVILFGDFDGDRRADLLAADLDGVWIYSADKAGQFASPPAKAWSPAERMHNPFVMTSGDVDADGDLDLYLAQYKLPYVGGQMPTPFYDASDGFAGFLLLNVGRGVFSDSTEEAGLGPKRYRRTYSASFVDLDRDTDLDLILVSDFRGVDIFVNDGKGRFRDATAELITEPHAFGMAHTFGDYNLDGALDILMLGMRSDAASRLDRMNLDRPGFAGFAEHRKRMTVGSRLYFGGAAGFRETRLSEAVRNAGWAWGATSLDFDEDGDEDIYVVNGHNSRSSVADYESQFWRHDIYVGGSELNRATEMYIQASASRLYGAGHSYGGYYKNKLYLNQRGTNFIEVGFLFGLAIEEDCRNLISADLDGDGDLDLAFTTYEQWPRMRHGVHVFLNGHDAGSYQLPLGRSGAAPGTRATVRLKDGRTVSRVYVTGDSFRSQHPPVLNFGIASNAVSTVNIHRPNEPEPVGLH